MKQIVTKTVDDIDGSDAEATVRFGIDRNDYEIDLSEENHRALREALAPFVSAARKVRRSKAAAAK